MSKDWWQESSKEFAVGFSESPAQQGKTINLGEHQAFFEKTTDKLSLFDEKQMIRLSADEAYRLLIWLQAHYSDRLSQQARAGGTAEHAAAKEISEEEIQLVEEAQVPQTPAIDDLVQREIEREEGGGEPAAEGGR